jgi:hypothetical protein
MHSARCGRPLPAGPSTQNARMRDRQTCVAALNPAMVTRAVVSAAGRLTMTGKTWQARAFRSKPSTVHPAASSEDDFHRR